jgi:hypothetical protein
MSVIDAEGVVMNEPVTRSDALAAKLAGADPETGEIKS